MTAFDAYVQAAFHGGTMPGGPTFTVIHDAETPLDYGYADAIADFFRRGPKAGTSAHAMVGPEKAFKLLPDNVVAWAAGPYANPRGWHLEQTGYASFTRAQWTTPKGIAQIGRTANCVREVHDTWGIPKRWMTDDQLRRAAKGDRASGGMTTHQQVARVLGGTTHTDPQERYPRDLLLQAVLGGSPTTTATLGDPDMRLAIVKGTGGPVYEITDLDVTPTDNIGRVNSLSKAWGITVTEMTREELQEVINATTERSARRVNDILDAPIQRNEKAGGGVTTLRAQAHWEDYNHRTVTPEAVAKAVGTPDVDADTLAKALARPEVAAAIGEAMAAATDRRARDGDPATGPVS